MASFTKADVKAIIDMKGLDNLSAKSVRISLEERLGLEEGALKPAKATISEMIDAVLNDMPIAMIERLMLGLRSDLLLIPCRSARLNWPTVETILRKRPLPHAIDHATLEIAQRDYRRLSLETAQRTVRFWQLHKRIEKQPMAAG